jgi:hypothetical protein
MFASSVIYRFCCASSLQSNSIYFNPALLSIISIKLNPKPNKHINHFRGNVEVVFLALMGDSPPYANPLGKVIMTEILE